MSPIRVHLDQLSLKFILEFFKIKLEPEKHANTIDQQSSPLIDTVSVSQIGENMIKSQNLNQNNIDEFNTLLDHKITNFYVRRIYIHEFFISFCYNSQKLSLQNLKEKNILEIINISSISDLQLIFKTFDYSNLEDHSHLDAKFEKKLLLNAIKDIYSFWKEDILSNQIVNAYLSSISIIKPFKNIVVGFFEIFKQPYRFYKEDKSINDGIAIGVKNFVVSFSTESLTIGEKVFNFIKKIVLSFIERNLRHKNKEKNKKQKIILQKNGLFIER